MFAEIGDCKGAGLPDVKTGALSKRSGSCHFTIPLLCSLWDVKQKNEYFVLFWKLGDHNNNN